MDVGKRLEIERAQAWGEPRKKTVTFYMAGHVNEPCVHDDTSFRDPSAQLSRELGISEPVRILFRAKLEFSIELKCGSVEDNTPPLTIFTATIPGYNRTVSCDDSGVADLFNGFTSSAELAALNPLIDRLKEVLGDRSEAVWLERLLKEMEGGPPLPPPNWYVMTPVQSENERIRGIGGDAVAYDEVSDIDPDVYKWFNDLSHFPVGANPNAYLGPTGTPTEERT